LARVKSLRIPPAWKEVWICKDAKGHIQATGKDERGRKQYIYHPEWKELRSQTKFHKLLTLAEVLPKIRRTVSKDISRKEIDKPKVVATVIELAEKTLIRIGNEEYVKENHSYGLTTIRINQVKIKGPEIHFHFKGKSGVLHDVDFFDEKLAKVVLSCEEIHGQELFSFRDHSGNVHGVHSGDVNEYLKLTSGVEISVKDFRTWYGTVKAHSFLVKCEPSESVEQRKKNVGKTIEFVSSHLRNTKAVCRKSYVDPKVIECYLSGEELTFPCKCGPKFQDLHVDEHALVHFLKRSN
jgi:DNA topoisomerase-1